MGLNREMIGKTCVSPSFYVVGREKIREFARAVGDTHLVFHSPDAAREAGYPDLVAPPTFAVIVTAGSAEPLLFDPAFGLDYSRVVHGEQRFRHLRPITAGDHLSTRSRIVSVRDIGSNELVETETEVIDRAGDVVCIAVNVIVSRGTAASEVAS